MEESAGQDRSKATKWAIVAAHMGFPLGNGLTPLVVFKRPGERDPFVQRHAAAAFDFQMTLVGATLAVALLVLVLVRGTPGVLLFLLIIVGEMIFEVVFEIRASIAAWRGHEVRYPPSLRMLRRKL